MFSLVIRIFSIFEKFQSGSGPTVKVGLTRGRGVGPTLGKMVRNDQ